MHCFKHAGDANKKSNKLKDISLGVLVHAISAQLIKNTIMITHDIFVTQGFKKFKNGEKENTKKKKKTKGKG